VSVEIAWVERTATSFEVKRSEPCCLGKPLVFGMPTGELVLVISGVADQKIGDAEVLLAVASVLSQGGNAPSFSMSN
jgi:hypothetical protein